MTEPLIITDTRGRATLPRKSAAFRKHTLEGGSILLQPMYTEVEFELQRNDALREAIIASHDDMDQRRRGNRNPRGRRQRADG